MQSLHANLNSVVTKRNVEKKKTIEKEKMMFFIIYTVNPEYFVRIQFSYPGLSTFRTHEIFVQALTAADSPGMLCTFRMHFYFVRKAARTKYTKKHAYEIFWIYSILKTQHLHRYTGNHYGFPPCTTQHFICNRPYLTKPWGETLYEWSSLFSGIL